MGVIQINRLIIFKNNRMIRVNDHLRYEQVVPSVGIDIGGSDTMNDIVAEASREQDCLMEIEDGGLKSFSLFGNPSPSTSKHDKGIVICFSALFTHFKNVSLLPIQ